MENFSDIKYERVDYDKTKQEIEELIEKFKNSMNYEEALDLYKKIIEIQNHIEEMYDIADIRNMRNCKDEYYENEINFWNEFKPKFDLIFNSFYKAVLSSPYIEKLKETTPINFFNTINYKLKISNSNIVDLEKKENELKRRYLNIIRTKVIYKGEEIKLAGFAKYFNSNDREVRKDAHDHYNDFFYEHMDELDSIFEELVKVRNKIARASGYKDYSEYSLYKLRRFGYNYNDIKEFRNGIYKYFINLCEMIRDDQMKNLGITELKYYDTIFFSESPNLKYQGKELLEKIIQIFNQIDKDLGKVISDLIEKDYIDLLKNDSKVNFGITNYLCESKIPVVTGNYKDVPYDITLTYHECGHVVLEYLLGHEILHSVI